MLELGERDHLAEYMPLRVKKLRLADIKELFELMRDRRARGEKEMTTAQRRCESDGPIAHHAAVEFIRSCTGNEIVAFVPDAPPLWWRLYDGKESKGALFERTVLKDCLPGIAQHDLCTGQGCGI